MKIYVLIDFSDFSNTQVKLANKWCLKFGYNMVLVNEINFLIPSLLGSPDVRLQLEYKQKRVNYQKLTVLRETLIDNLVQVTIEVTALPLIKFMREELQFDDRDIILMGVKGTGTLKQIFIGSMVTTVIEEVNQLTLSLPIHLETHLPDKLVIAVHYKTPINESALQVLLSGIKSSLKQIEFITIITNPIEKYESEAYLLAQKRKFDVVVDCDVNLFSGIDALNDLKKYVLPQKSVFLVIQKGSRSLADKMFRKFMVNEMVFDASLPLIVLPV